MELVQYAKRVLRWWWLILACTALAAVASYVASSRQPHIYQTTTTLMVGQVIQHWPTRSTTRLPTPLASIANSKTATPGRRSGVSSGGNSRSIPASHLQPMIEVAKPVIDWAAAIAQ